MVSLLESGMASMLDTCLLFALSTKPTEIKNGVNEFIWFDFSIRFGSVGSGETFDCVQGRDFVISLRLPDRSSSYVSVPYEFNLTLFQTYLIREIHKRAVSYVERGCRIWV